MTTSTSIDIAKLRGFGTDVALGDKMTTGEILACAQVLLMGGRQSSCTSALLCASSSSTSHDCFKRRTRVLHKQVLSVFRLNRGSRHRTTCVTWQR